MEQPANSAVHIIIGEAARCVQCAMCLPFCPTFRQTNSESESPRGRISLAAAIAAGRLNDAASWSHLDHCLGCNACGRMCPSHVDYDSLRKAVYRLDTRPVSLGSRLLTLLLGSRADAHALTARIVFVGKKLPHLLRQQT